MLDLRNIVKAAGSVAFEVFGQIKCPGTYSNVTGSTHVAGSGVATPIKTDVPCSPILASYKATDIDGERVKQGDEKLIFENWRLVSNGVFEPTINDYFVETATDIRRNVIEVFTDPTRNIAIIQVRRVARRTS